MDMEASGGRRREGGGAGGSSGRVLLPAEADSGRVAGAKLGVDSEDSRLLV